MAVLGAKQLTIAKDESMFIKALLSLLLLTPPRGWKELLAYGLGVIATTGAAR
ncbi:MAG: hypothetical protein ABSD11_19620 [Methylocella sp.]